MATQQEFTKVWSIEGKGLKLETAEDVQEFVKEIVAFEDLEVVVMSGNTVGVEAGKALAEAFKQKKSLKVMNLSDIFTGRLRSEIPPVLKAICDALEDKEELIELNLSDNAFGPAGAEPMVDFLANNRHLQVLKLNNNGLGVQGGNLIAKALLAAQEKNVAEGRPSSLRTIIAGRNRLENGSSKALAEAFEAHGTLREIRLPQNGIRPEGIELLAKSLAKCSSLEVLDLQDNTFTDVGARAVADALPSWPKLSVLNIGDCLLGKRGGVAIAEALKSGHECLSELILTYNEIQQDAAEILADAVATMKNLRTLELNGNYFPEDSDVVDKIREILSENGNEEALGSLSDMEELSEDEEEEEASEEEEEEEEEKEKDEVDELADKLSSVKV
ncbi:RNI-like protein [Basidiobolus meristosporus CBS 931.73]|uniref:RNI-like protein n=1 Tax=Basidiobolus meristosporus CBS 931.73 TaxID=1314790 RepID=A0A1Y1Z549_9FUNG|nr:RNI-like protein [Basidiobolus meristosporus CBS 931.73]|eukprot:ORY05422.1 RNI-like protein [Basidiobolus meristosporus CBS 931.73]